MSAAASMRTARRLMERTKFPCLLWVHGKDDDSFYYLRDGCDLERAALSLMSGRLVDGYLDEDAAAAAQAIVAKRDGQAALAILWDRRDYEYERVSLEEFEEC